MSSLNQKALDKLQHPIEGEVIELRDKIKLLGNRTYIDFDLDELITKRAMLGLNGMTYEVPFEDVATLQIDWQNDLVPGYAQTFAELLGDNLPKCFVYTVDPDDADGFIITGSSPKPKRVDGLITFVDFDFGGISSTGIIVF